MTVLVTGASSGIGRAICERLLVEGRRVVGLARDFSKFPCDHPGLETHRADLADSRALPGLLRTLERACPDIEALVCNAGRGRFGDLEQFSLDQIRELVDLNFTSHACLVRTFLPRLKKAGRGHLVFMGSEAALSGARKGAVYCASKFALRGFAQSLRLECAGAGVRVTLVNPGMVETPFYDELDFAPGADPACHILPADVAEVVSSILRARPGTVFDEINLSPQKRVIDFGAGKKEHDPLRTGGPGGRGSGGGT